ncbi:hypothetical protein Megvenef_00338 [Candidatus Megaera venefica]|uniref:Uncharacterized protein n=1 Tax=Candidatus Megaera venefica TaxID=2055910 RepID=A0ABU5NB45_9RICK|nr:hypothetical protein [Candidatus Megaera venefica]MEA0970379.1 hypothetical protein [Candidatus Megaera venefica]
MPLFLKSIAPEIDIFGNRQLLNFNRDPSSGESDSALTLINWFTPILNVNANSTFEFLTPAMKGFRFNHSLSTTGTFGNFNFEKYDRFGLATPLWGYDEVTDSLVFNKEGSFVKNTANNQINLVSTSLDTVGNLKLNITKKIPNTQTYKGYQLSYEYSDSIGDSFSLYRDSNSTLDRLFAHSETLNVFLFYRSISMNTNRITNLGNAILSSDVVNKGQMDSADATTLTSAQTYTNNKTWLASQVTNFDTQVRTNRLDQMSIPTSSLNLNSQRIINLTNPVNAQDGATKQYVDNQSGGTGAIKSFMHGYLSPMYNTNITTSDHIKFGSFYYYQGTSIVLDTSSAYSNSIGTASIGRITLSAGKSYKLLASLSTADFTSTSGYLGLRWHNSDTNSPIGGVTTWWHPSSNYFSGGVVAAVIMVSNTTRVELKINSVSNVGYIRGSSDYNSAAWFIAEEI